MNRALTVVSNSLAETSILGTSLAPVLVPGDVVTLSGDLGAGKTTFVQGVAAALGVTGPVTSPTFVIIHHYEGRFPVVHLDVEIRRTDDGDDVRRFAFRAVGREWERKLERVRVTAEALLDAASLDGSGGSRFSYRPTLRTRDHGSGADEKNAEA